MMRFWEKRHWPFWVTTAVMTLTLVLRLPLLNGSFWLDEAAQAIESARPWTQQLQIAKDFQPPLYHLIVHLFVYGGRAEWWLRLASVLPALGASWFVMDTVRRNWEEKAAFTAGVLMATSSLLVYFSQELRPYMLAVFFAAVSWWAYDHWIWKPVIQKGRWNRFGILFAGAILGGAYSSYVFLFWPLGFFLATFFWRRTSVKSLIWGNVVAALGFLPWVGMLWQQLQVGSTLRQSLPGWDQVVSTPMLKSLPLLAAKFLVGVQTVDFTWRDGLILILPYAVLGFSLVQTLWLTRKKKSFREVWQGLGLLLCLFCVPILAAWLASFVTPVLAPKRILFVLPLLFAFIGWLMRYNSKWGVFTFSLFLLWQSSSLVQYWTNPLLQREDWRGLVQEIDSRFSSENTSVVMGFSEPFAPWLWYHHQPFVTVSTGTSPLVDLPTTDTLLVPVKHAQHVLVFDYLRDLTDPFHFIEASLKQSGFRELGALDKPMIGFVRVYSQNHLYAEGQL